jgi:hypothetical protein
VRSTRATGRDGAAARQLPRAHVAGDGERGGWTCSCGKVGDRGSAADHLARVGDQAVRLLSGPQLRAVVLVTASRGGAEGPAMRLLGATSGVDWGLLREFLRVGWDSFGMIRMRVDWARLGAALDAGTVAAAPEALAVLALAASLAGGARVDLAGVARELRREDRTAALAAFTMLLTWDE